ncbi:hypothetical protein [Streptomyces sp. HNM0574]|uniref:hypothetical protein n=1 Tax=Streptomyces sp. HNM0574 TaxID=2714954 RepID=UPI00146F03F7|nr:hypothetical protein [Streptomyces sp. HNM0574]NLU69087.1 hypothetical protein [Streptomyces sp. HNM0574]
MSELGPQGTDSTAERQPEAGGTPEHPEPEPPVDAVDTVDAADTAEEPEPEAESDGPEPLGVGVTPTGDGDVDARLRRLEAVDHLAVSGHLDVYEDVHSGLREQLAALDRPRS